MHEIIMHTGTETSIYDHGTQDALRVDAHYRDGELIAATCELIDAAC